MNENSIAEKSGLQVGDVIVRINETSTIKLDHHGAHEIIMACANNFVLGVIRPDENGNVENVNVSEGIPTDFSVDENSSEKKRHLQMQTPDSQAYSEITEMTINSNGMDSTKTELDENITDEHIAEMMSGEAEVLKEHNVMGYDFYSLFFMK